MGITRAAFMVNPRIVAFSDKDKAMTAGKRAHVRDEANLFI